ncbi:MAG: tetratricopeptide repeat protein [Bacteroidota bacterium]
MVAEFFGGLCSGRVLRTVICFAMCLAFCLSGLKPAEAQHSNAEKEDSLARELKIAKTTVQTANALVGYGNYYFTNRDSSKAFPYMRQALFTAAHNNNDSLKTVVRWHFILMLQSFGQDLQALAYLDEINIKYLGFMKNPVTRILFRKGLTYHNQGKYPEAVKAYVDGLRAIKDTTDFGVIGLLHRNLAVSIGMGGNREEVLAHCTEAIKYFRKAGDLNSEGTVHITLSNVYTNAADVINAEKHLQLAVSMFRKTKRYKGLASAYGNLGSLESERGNYKKALQYLSDAIRIRHDSVAGAMVPDFVSAIAETYFKMKQYDKAIFFSDSSIAMIKREQKRGLLDEAYYLRARIYDEVGNYKEAIKYLKLHYALKDTIYHFDREKILQETHTKYKTEVKEQENKLLKKDLETENTRRWLLLTGIAALVVVLILSTFLFLTRIKAAVRQREFLESNLAHEKLQQELEKRVAAAEQARMVTEQNALKANLEQKNTELSNLTAYMVRKNEIIASMKLNIEKVHGKDKKLERVMEEMDSFIDLDQEWKEFLRCFEAVNPGFNERLNSHCPDLTQKEVKMCSYIRMNLEVKEIGRLLNITDASIHNFRSRLRKKLNLDPGADINNFLNNL